MSEEKLYKYCIRCGRLLKNTENRKRGMGQICWLKYQTELTKKHKLF